MLHNNRYTLNHIGHKNTCFGRYTAMVRQLNNRNCLDKYNNTRRTTLHLFGVFVDGNHASFLCCTCFCSKASLSTRGIAVQAGFYGDVVECLISVNK